MDKSVPAPAARLLDFIRLIEVGTDAPSSYEVIFGHNQRKLTKPITKMTIDELQAAQPGFTKAFQSSASGGYQFMKDTLAGLIVELRLRGSQVFDANLQDRLGYHLLLRRRYGDWISGRITDDAFMLNLAKEWASFPRPDNGRSYYDGDGLNKALVKRETVRKQLALAKLDAGRPVPTPAPPGPIIPPRPDPVPTHDVAARTPGFWAAMWAALKNVRRA